MTPTSWPLNLTSPQKAIEKLREAAKKDVSKEVDVMHNTEFALFRKQNSPHCSLKLVTTRRHLCLLEAISMRLMQNQSVSSERAT